MNETYDTKTNLNNEEYKDFLNQFYSGSSTANSTAVNSLYSDCFYRLPCGLCRITNSQCPTYMPKITWTGEPYTVNYCKTDSKANENANLKI